MDAVYWISGPAVGRLAIAPRPRGGDWLEDDVHKLKREGVDVLVSLLESAEAEELGLSDESGCYAAAGIEFCHFPVRDRYTPVDVKAFSDFIAQLRWYVAQGRAVAIHCRAGIGRAALLAASVLADAVSADEAFQRIAQARGCLVPDAQEQLDWVRDFSRGMTPAT